MVQKDPPLLQIPDSPVPDTKILLLIAGAVIVIAVVAIVLAGGLLKPGTPSPPPDVSPVPTPLGIAGSQNQQPAAVTTHGQAAPGPTKKPVDFLLESGDLVSCGLTCRDLTARIINTGDTKAHNVCISLRMHNSRGDTIELNGGDTLSQCIGDLDARQDKSEPVTINADCGALAYKCLKETLTLETEVISDEVTIRFPDRIIVV
ncbi:MAG: hypothetical protein OS112_01405 [Methanoregula sp.]|nr:MAG: hypothetical protein OS112_01405 [Methanoregula sp.]